MYLPSGLAYDKGVSFEDETRLSHDPLQWMVPFYHNDQVVVVGVVSVDEFLLRGREYTKFKPSPSLQGLISTSSQSFPKSRYLSERGRLVARSEGLPPPTQRSFPVLAFGPTGPDTRHHTTRDTRVCHDVVESPV